MLVFVDMLHSFELGFALHLILLGPQAGPDGLLVAVEDPLDASE